SFLLLRPIIRLASTLFPYTTLFRSWLSFLRLTTILMNAHTMYSEIDKHQLHGMQPVLQVADVSAAVAFYRDLLGFEVDFVHGDPDRKSTRLNSSHGSISYAVFCLKK